jgi:hypothetical protein
VTIGDLQAVAARWHQTNTSSTWNPTYDLDSNGVISIIDIVRVSSAWGRTCN